VADNVPKYIFFRGFQKNNRLQNISRFRNVKIWTQKRLVAKKDSVIIFHPIFEWRRTIVQNKTTKNKIEKIARKPWKGT
jgi:hypothetical protein